MTENDKFRFSISLASFFFPRFYSLPIFYHPFLSSHFPPCSSFSFPSPPYPRLFLRLPLPSTLFLTSFPSLLFSSLCPYSPSQSLPSPPPCLSPHLYSPSLPVSIPLLCFTFLLHSPPCLSLLFLPLLFPFSFPSVPSLPFFIPLRSFSSLLLSLPSPSSTPNTSHTPADPGNRGYSHRPLIVQFRRWVSTSFKRGRGNVRCCS